MKIVLLSVLSCLSAGMSHGQQELPAILVSREDFSLNDFVAAVKQNRHQRELTHTVPSLLTPRGCEYTENHSPPDFVDEIFCPSFCGGDDFTAVVTSLGCDSNGRNCKAVSLDCLLDRPGCCSGIGNCVCRTMSFEDACSTTEEFLCFAPEPTSSPSEEPTLEPTISPTASSTTPPDEECKKKFLFFGHCKK